MKQFATLIGTLLLIAGTAIAQDSDRQWTESDRLLMSVQKICPVSGEPLGTMGQPVKVRIGEQVAFLCCQGCQNKQVNAEHWATIQFNIASAQQTCPIMEKPVTSEMKSTIVNGQPVFVCCPPCIAKIQADQGAAWQKVAANYESFVKAETQAKSDQLHIQAQAICPVSGQKLGSMGETVKVQVGEEHAFLCCKGCIEKKLSPEHWATVQSNLAQAQAVCPVMGEPIDSSMESIVVNGRKIFVCCPPCIEKIKADPTSFVAQLDSRIAHSEKSLTENEYSDQDQGHDRHDHSQRDNNNY